MPRPPATGNYDTREELVEAVRQYRVQKKTQGEIAKLTGVSTPTVNKILKDKIIAAQENEGAGDSSIVGLWCACWQKVDGIKSIPWHGKILADHQLFRVLELDGKEFRVNRGACSDHAFER